MSKTTSASLSFGLGLNEFLEPSRLPDGTATELVNWIPESDGSLRTRQAWQPIVTTGLATTDAKGIIYFPKLRRYVVAVRDGNTYRLYSRLKSDLGTAASWTLIEQTPAVTDASKPLAMAVGLGYLFYCTDEFSSMRRWDGTAVTTVAAAKVGRTLTFYRNRLFSAGGPATTPDAAGATQIYRTWFSDLGTADTWAATNYMDIGKDDGEAIESVVPFENGLLHGKESSLTYVQGTSPSTFQVINLDSGSATPGRSIVATPYGAVVTGPEALYLWDGSQPVPLSKPVSTSYAAMPTAPYRTLAYAEDVVYLVDGGTGTNAVLAYNLVNQTWHTEKSPLKLTFLYSQSDTQLAGTTTQFLYRESPGGERGRDSLTGDMTYRVKTPELWYGGAAGPFTVRHAFVRVRQREGSVTDPGLTIRSYINGELKSSTDIEPRPEPPSVFRQRLDFGGTGYFIQFEIEQTLATTEQAALDIEEIELVLDVEEDR